MTNSTPEKPRPSDQTLSHLLFSGKRPVAVGVIIAMAIGLVVIATWPQVGSREAPKRTQCKNNLKQIVLALHNYHDAYGSFPPAYIADKNGRPMHSWRVLLLPYLDQAQLYDKYRFNEPWNGPNNSIVAKTRLPVFCCPSDDDSESAATSYLAVIGPNTAWPGERPVSIKGISDGTEKTAHIVEVADSGIGWAEPRDFYINQIPMQLNPKHGFGISSRHDAGAQMGFVDGSARFVPDTIEPQTLRRLLERNDGGDVGDF